ncbi:MAG: methyltransferase domain-containing protein [Solirubrobacterales bacterium]|nr:methyltransferase domain-containing protein [Solirubrobacterales bacterium]
MMVGGGPADWDASGYAQTATPQMEWSGDVLDRLRLTGVETVLDAGCGSGGVTATLLERLPRGRVVALDGSPAMIAEAERHLSAFADQGRVSFTCQDLGEFQLDIPVDRVFSNAVFHWVPDHPALFRRLAAALRPGGRLVAQYGGSGNVTEQVTAIRELVACGDFSPWLDGYRTPWTFNGPTETARWLVEAGFDRPECDLEERIARPEDPRRFFETSFLAEVRERLPEQELPRFVDRAMVAMGNPRSFRYIRLNIDARRI